MKDRETKHVVGMGLAKNARRMLASFGVGAALMLLTSAFDPSAISAQRKSLGQAEENHRVQATMELDVRDVGVDCTFTTDSSAALNSITAASSTNGRAITFPPGCHAKLAKTWFIKNLSGFTIRGTSGAGNNGHSGTNVPTITWTGSSGGTMIDMEYVDGFEVDHLAIDGGGLAAVGINVDKSGTCGGCVNTTDGVFRRLGVNANYQGAGNANWIGMLFSNVSTSNVEDMRITDSTFFCGGSATSGIAAIKIANSSNAKNFLIEHNFIHDCNIGVWGAQGAANILQNEVGSNHTDFEIDYYTDPIQISYNLSESAESGDRFLVLGNVNHVVEVTGNNIPVNNTCAITLNGGTVSSPSGNTFYKGFEGGAGGNKICNGPTPTNTPFIIGGLSTFDLTSNDIGFLFAKGFHAVVDSMSVSNAAKQVPLSTGATFIERAVYYNNIDNGGTRLEAANQVQPATACALNTICRDEGSEETGGVVSPDGSRCTVTGADTTTRHSYYVSAVDPSGNETFLAPANAVTCRGPGRFDGSHYETISWLPSPNASYYNVYAANPIAPGDNVEQVAAGLIGTSFQFNGPFPITFTIKGEKNLYNKTLYRIFRGKTVDFQFGTPVRGFSDKGVTQKWTIDSLTGTATFTRITGIADTTIVKNLNCNYLDGKDAGDFAPAEGTVDGKDIAPKSVVTSAMRLDSSTTPKCDATHRGQLNYVAGGQGTKDVVQICMKAADESYGWRVVY